MEKDLCFYHNAIPNLYPLKVFAEVKPLLQANDSIYLASTAPELMVKLAFTTITQENCWLT